MIISATQVAELRKMTGCSMMDCKRALEDTKGNLDLAVEVLRKKGMAKAANKAGREAAEGIIHAQVSDDQKTAVLLEVNCETDFVARDANFQHFAEKLIHLALAQRTCTVDALSALVHDGKTVEQWRQELVAKLGENLQIRRVHLMEASHQIGSYVHGGRIGAVVALAKGDAELAKDLAMHIVAHRPQYVEPREVSPSVIEKEKVIYEAQAKETGKPAAIIEKMVQGRIDKYLNEICLVGQPFVRNPDITVGELLKQKQGMVERFVCFALGEGIVK